MWTAIWVTFLIFVFLYSGIYVLKRSADKFKIPDNVKAQPYTDDEESNTTGANQSKNTQADNANKTP
ncbi:MAG: hypothetical protein HWD86_01120 [Kangiellaceae bacterium]|nr:hypothetical protein [Kangiellaceae bacterium]